MSLLKVNEVTDLGGDVPEGVRGFTALTIITATDAAWAVPTLASPIVKVTVIGGGGGGGADITSGNNGGTTTFNAGGAGTVTAAGGSGGKAAVTNADGRTATVGFSSGNSGGASVRSTTVYRTATDGAAGAVTISYLDLTGISTVNVSIGAGGAASGSSPYQGSAGGRGEVIVEYVAG